MDRAHAPTALLALPPVAGHSALRAGLMAMSVPPTVLPRERRERERLLERLAGNPATVAFIDISPDRTDALKLGEVEALLPERPMRARVHLTRLAGGHVSEADRHWVRALGFADLVPEFDALDCEGQLRSTLDAVATALSRPVLPSVELARYARVMNAETDRTSPRAVIRALTGLSAEALATLLAGSLAIEDRAYRLQTYPRCFVGSQAVAWMSRHLHRSTAEAVALGQALGALGLLVHVAHDHPFLDDHLFYRLATSSAADRLGLGDALTLLTGPDGPAVTDWVYHFKKYEQCWAGSEAVDRLVAARGLQRHDAWIVLHRLMQFGLIAHVSGARPVVDGHFFYRFSGKPAMGAR